ncbi:MAG: hypothetical protein H6732_17395 [Alphaproteobacteria bacterium]|nr:hypothetical protein [Alphaproteobacteria bacterium]
MRPALFPLVLALAACGTSPADKASDTDTDVVDTDTDTVDSGDTADSDDSADTGTAATTCDDAPRPDGTKDWVRAVQLDAGAAPTPQGGTITDGTYALTAAAHHGSATSSDGSRALLVLEAGVTRWVLTRDREGDTYAYCDQGTVVTDGTTFQLVKSATNVFSDNYAYTASADVVTLFWHPGVSEQVNTVTYTRVP